VPVAAAKEAMDALHSYGHAAFSIGAVHAGTGAVHISAA
jgi:hypothetical protein